MKVQTKEEHTVKRNNRIMALALAAALGLGWTSSAKADDTSANISIAKFISNLKIGGDLRIRQENFWKSTPGQTDRSRQRYRLRFGINPVIENYTVVFRMASGTGEQVSTNQSFDNLSAQKSLWIDQAYIGWKAFEWMGFTASAAGGRMQNPLWRIYTSDIVFDDDFNPEGFSQAVEYKHGRGSVFFNAMQAVLDEDSTDNRDQWMYAFQVGAKTRVYKNTAFNIAASLIDLENERVNDFGAAANNEGNTRFQNAASTGTAFFTMAHLTAEIKSKVWILPVTIMGDYVNNIADNSVDPRNARSNTVQGSSGTQKVGYQFGLIIGEAKAAKSWEIAYFYKLMETNATLADISDSDFGDGGTNRKGHIFWIAFNPKEFLQIKAKFFNTEVLREDLAPRRDHINRFQLDASIKF